MEQISAQLCTQKTKGRGGGPIFCLSFCANFPCEPEQTLLLFFYFEVEAAFQQALDANSYRFGAKKKCNRRSNVPPQPSILKVAYIVTTIFFYCCFIKSFENWAVFCESQIYFVVCTNQTDSSLFFFFLSFSFSFFFCSFIRSFN